MPTAFAVFIATILVIAPPKPGMTAHVHVPLPISFEGWISEEMRVTQEEINILTPQALSKRRYVSMDNPDHEIVLLVAVYDDRQLAGSHSADRCFAALGWSLLSNKSRTLPRGSLNLVSGQAAVAASKPEAVQEYVFQRLQFRQRVFEAVLPMGSYGTQVARIQLVIPADLAPAVSDRLLEQFSRMVTGVAI
ncbi:MAG: exosortase-associated EpsI family protein [Pseudomonadota bacterium]